ncbi:MAG: hypothetical protein ACR2OC_12415 [Solirubrobacterales bacterium]
MKDSATAMDNDIVKKLVWSGLIAATGALANVLAYRLAVFIWGRAFNEDPPD